MELKLLFSFQPFLQSPQKKREFFLLGGREASPR